MPYKDPVKQREYIRQWMAKRRADFFQDKYCVVCKTIESLELDHIDPSTKVSHNIWSWCKEKRDIELSKCQVLCRNHHEMKTAEENRQRNGGLRHGTETMYCKYKCRCELCRKARSLKKQANRAKRKALGLPQQ